MANILVVDDEVGIRDLLWEILNDEGHTVEVAENAAQARVARQRERPDLVLLDIWMPDTDGVTLLKEWSTTGLLSMPVIMMSGHATIDTAVEAMRLGAFDFVQKPVDLEQLEARVARAVEHGRLLREVTTLREECAARRLPSDVIARSASFRSAIELAERVAATRSTVLITGETGTGKEVIAGMLHALSTRSQAPLVRVNCAALPETLLESELFGHERGAFTGADRLRIGRF